MGGDQGQVQGNLWEGKRDTLRGPREPQGEGTRSTLEEGTRGTLGGWD